MSRKTARTAKFSLAVILLLHTTLVFAADVYVAQSSAGGGTGANCANARAVSSLASGDWLAGNTIHLCGAITSTIASQGGGVNSNPITVHAEPGAGVAVAAVSTSGEFQIHHNYIVLDGGGGSCGWPGRTNVTCAQGYIKSTANGSGLANQVASEAIKLDSGLTGIEVKGWNIGPLYSHTSTSDTIVDQTATNCVRGFSQTNISIHNNTCHDVGWAFDIGGAPGGATTGSITQNEIYNMDHGIAGGSPLNASMFSNHLHDMANWDTLADAYHHDGFHVFTDNGANSSPIEYDNLFDGDMGNNVTAWIYNEASSGTMTALSFNNVAYVAPGRNSCCGVLGVYSDGGPNNSSQQYNNAVIGPQNTGTITGPASLIGGGGASHITGAAFVNNLLAIGCCQHEMAIDTGATVATIKTNAYEDVATDYGANFTNFGWHGSDVNSASIWASDSGETGAVFGTLAFLKVSTSTAVPSTGSPLCGAGTNLTNLGIAALNSDANGNPRPASGPWDIGPYNCSNAPPPATYMRPSSERVQIVN